MRRLFETRGAGVVCFKNPITAPARQPIRRACGVCANGSLAAEPGRLSEQEPKLPPGLVHSKINSSISSKSNNIVCVLCDELPLTKGIFRLVLAIPSKSKDGLN